MKLSEYKNEEALDLLADLLEPTATILADEEIATASRSNTSKLQLIKIALKKHKVEVIEILARLEGVEVKDYSANIAQMISKLLEILNDKELIDFFGSQGLTEVQTPSGSATENIKGKKK